MEVDTVDVDLELMNRLTSMSTRDKEDLLAQFQSIVGSQMSPGCCSFYLEMGNWNLQTALCAYYDIMSSPEKLPTFELVDETQHINEYSVAPNSQFSKTWRLRNTGIEPWNNNLRLKFVKGQNMGHAELVALPPIAHNETTDITVAMTAPSTDGVYESLWRVVTLAGAFCGNPLSATVAVVESSNISFLTQQMSTLGAEKPSIAEHSAPISTPFHPPVAATPFCSPTGHGIFGGNSVPTNSLNGHLPTITENNLNQLMHRTNLLNEFDAAENQNDYDIS